jgi:hypothetical protein
MSKALDIIMAGVISGIVAYATSQLGLTGTIIGAVIGSLLYQLMSHLFQKPLDNVKTQKIEQSIFYVFPLIIILAIEVIYLFYVFSLQPGQLFYLLENATGWNLFRTMGVALLVMGVYPLLEPESISPRYGYIILLVGVVTLMGGFADFNSSIVNLYSPIFYKLNEVISILVIAALSYVIFFITKESVTIINEEDHSKEEEEDHSKEEEEDHSKEEEEDHSKEEEEDHSKEEEEDHSKEEEEDHSKEEEEDHSKEG